MSDHSFNPFVAKEFGVNVAIFINSAVFWTRINAAKALSIGVENSRHYQEDRFWFYGTPEYFLQYFPYFTEKQIKYTLQKCVSSGLLQKGNFNTKGYDKTNWYALTDWALIALNLDKTCLQPNTGLIGQNCPMHRTKLSDAQDKIVLPIPDTKTDTKPDSNIYTREQNFEPAEEAPPKNTLKPVEYKETYSPLKQSASISSQLMPTEKSLKLAYNLSDDDLQTFESFWSLYPVRTNKVKCQNEWFCRGLHRFAEEIITKLSKQIRFDKRFKNSEYTPAPLNWLRGQQWNDEIVTSPKGSGIGGFNTKDTSWANPENFGLLD